MINTKKTIVAAVLFLLFFSAAVSNDKVSAKKNDVSLEKGEVTLNAGTSEKISLKGKTIKKKYSTSNRKVATVSSKGIIKAVNPGKCKIYVKIKYKKNSVSKKCSKKKLVCSVTVRKSRDTSENNDKQANITKDLPTPQDSDLQTDNQTINIPDDDSLCWLCATVTEVDNSTALLSVREMNDAPCTLILKNALIYKKGEITDKTDLKVGNNLRIGYTYILETSPMQIIAQKVYCE